MYRHVQLSLSQLDRPISYFNAVTIDIDSCTTQALIQSLGLQFHRSEVLNPTSGFHWWLRCIYSVRMPILTQMPVT